MFYSAIVVLAYVQYVGSGNGDVLHVHIRGIDIISEDAMTKEEFLDLNEALSHHGIDYRYFLMDEPISVTDLVDTVSREMFKIGLFSIEQIEDIVLNEYCYSMPFNPEFYEKKFTNGSKFK